MEQSYEAFLSTCRIGVRGVRIRGHYVRKAFRKFLEETFGLVPNRIYRKKFHNYLISTKGIDYDAESQTYCGIVLDRNLTEPSNRKSPTGKTSSDMDDSSSESIENKLLLIHPLLFIDRFGMPEIHDKTTIDRQELYRYTQWNKQQKERIASYDPSSDLDKEAQIGLLKMLEEEKALVSEMYLIPRVAAIQFSQVYFNRPVDQDMEDL